MSNFSVKDTDVSGNALASVLNGESIRDLMFDASCRSARPLSLLSGTTPVSLSVNDWVQASISSLLLNTVTLVSSATANVINLGSGVDQANAYVNFFDLGSGDSRIVRFGPPTTSVGAGSVILAGDATYVKVGASSTSSGLSSGTLFTLTSTSNVKNVQVYCANPDAGSGVVVFNVLG